jgi:hypothetical protein
MSARVFISCGQRDGERQIAAAVAEWLVSRGYRPYVALEAQSIQDVNSGILGELRRADYYVFIDFRREFIGGGEDGQFRGSLFSHQELAIAYAMGFEHAIFFREAGVRLEGVCAYLASNATRFDDRAAVPALVAEAVNVRGWRPEYSRNLVVGPLRMSDEMIQYRDLRGRFLYVDVQNRRPDAGATGVVARLSALQLAGQPRKVSPNRSHLKVTGQQQAFQQTIWPLSHGAFDLLCVNLERGSRVYLNNALDVLPTPLLFDSVGEHILEYEVFAHGFDIVRFSVLLQTHVDCARASAILVSGD